VNFSGLIQDFGPLTITGLAQGAIIALFALGYTLVYGVLRLINFAHSEVFLIGSYACLIVWGFFGLDQNSATPSVLGVIGLLLLGLVAAIVLSGLTALSVELVAYRPLRKRNAPPLAFLITAIGASLFISETVGVMTQRNIKGVPPLIQPRDVFVIGNMHVTNLQILIIVLALVMMFLLDRFINRSTPASCWASRRSPRPCSVVSATCAARCWAACCWVCCRTTRLRCSAPSGCTRRRSCCSC